MPTRTKKPQPQKKGTASWKPAGHLDIKKVNGYRMRWVDKDPMNVMRKEAEGWVPASSVLGVAAEKQESTDIESGSNLTSVTEYRELVAMCMPEETAELRNAHYQKKTDEQSAALVRNARREAEAIGPDAEVEGNITIIN